MALDVTNVLLVLLGAEALVVLGHVSNVCLARVHVPPLVHDALTEARLNYVEQVFGVGIRP